MTSRRDFLKIFGGSLTASLLAGGLHCRHSARRPNVVLIITDDQGWGDLHIHGNPQIDTPVLDKLSTESVRFERFFVSPVCAPTRASLLTGRDHLRTGTVWVTHRLETMRSNEVTLAEVLKQAGYATGCFGKWHNGAYYPHHPNAKGFDEFLGFCAGHWNNYFDTTLERNSKPIKTAGYITDVLTDAALEFINQYKNHPFFCYVPYNAPHGPFQVPDRYFEKYKQRGLNDKDACVYGMVENLDENIGRILQRLDQLNLTQDTIMIFLTDNGPNGQRFNGGMRGVKGSVHEGGIRVHCFIRWPGHLTAGLNIPQIAAHIDLLPTIVELCDLPPPETLPLDGVSLVPLLTSQFSEWPERMLFTHHSRRGQVELGPASVRTQRYRLVTDGTHWELYDLEIDPAETQNIASQQPEITRKLRAAYETWFEEVIQNGFEPAPIPVGYPQANPVELLAPDAHLNGNLAFKGKTGWANDWITNWTNTTDFVTWDIEVIKAGSYEISLLYTCPESSVGSRVRIEMADASSEAVITEPHDPSPIPSPDRVPRGEVYEKVWKSLSMGTLSLKPGKTHLKLRALSIPGPTAMELKGVRVKKL